MKKQFLMVNAGQGSSWDQIVSETLQSLGTLHFSSEDKVFREIKMHDFDLVIIDAIAIAGDIVNLVTQLHREAPEVPIVVATTSPTWQRTQQIFQAGAADYIRKSLDREKILITFQQVIRKRDISLNN